MITGELNREKTEKEYRAVPMLSASDLRLFNTDRKKFYKEKVLGEPRVEEYNKSILIGNLVHCLLLEPHAFDSRYMLSVCEKVPGGMLLAFVESLYRHSVASMDEEKIVQADFSSLVQIAYEESGYKIKLEAVIKKFEEDGKPYFDQMMEAYGKGLEIVCMDDINIANRIVEITKADPFVGGYFSNIENCELKAEGFLVDGVEMKMMADKIIADHEHETIQLIDPKVVFDNQNFFREYYLKKQAYIQGYIYYMGLKSGKIDLGFDYSKYVILPPIFVAIDSGCYYAPVQYRMTVGALKKAYEGFTEQGRDYRGVKETLEELNWAKETGNWTISKKAYDNQGIINLE